MLKNMKLSYIQICTVCVFIDVNIKDLILNEFEDRANKCRYLFNLLLFRPYYK